MNRALARRLAAVGSATLLAGALVALIAPSANAAQVITMLSQTSYVDSVGTDNIVGELRNDGTSNIESITLSFDFLDASGSVLSSDSTTALVDRLAPGEKAPFHETFNAPAGYDHYAVTTSATDVVAAPNHSFTTAITSEPTDSFGTKHLVGSVRNDNSTAADFVNVVFTFYDGAGQVVNAGSEYVNDDTIAPGGSSVIDYMVDPTPAYASYRTFAQSNTDAAPGASPSPTATPTATATPTDSPTPTATPTATETTPAVTLGQSIISAGQHVTVTYHGAPNTTLTILSKTQPATAYSVIGSVVLDSAGNGSTSHAPTKNTRIMARTAGGLASPQPLIQVRSVASINAKRIATRTYTFTGRVYPALNGRLVSLYRNGTLVAQARTNASGVYTLTKVLAAGTFSFQVRTANDTYNLGTTSPAHSYTIS